MTPREWRESKKMTGEEVAAKIGCSKGYVSLIERGKRTPSHKFLKAYEDISKGKVTLADFKTN